MNEREMVDKLSRELSDRSRRSGERFEVLADYAVSAQWGGRSPYFAPDLVVHDKTTGRYLILELKHYDHKRALALSTVPLARQLKLDSDPENVSVTVMTNSVVSDMVRGGLADEQVSLIEYVKEDQLADKVWDYLEAGIPR